MRAASLLRIAIWALLTCASTLATAQQSWIWSRDDNSRPINLNTDAVSLVLLEARVPSGNNFIANDSQVGLLIDTTFAGSTADDPQASRNFPLMFEESADLMQDANHPHSKILSNQKILVDYFPLSEDKTVYRSVSISVTLLRKQDPAVWTKILDSLLTATQGVTLPSPLTLGVTYLSKFSTDVLHKTLPDPDKSKRIDLGTFSFLISENPSSLNRVTQSGLHLRLLQPTGTGDGWVDPSKWDNYCFYTKFVGSNWAVYVAPKEKDPKAADSSSYKCSEDKYRPLMNDYVPLLVEVEQKATKSSNLQKHLNYLMLGTGGEAIRKLNERADDLHKAALAQCGAFHIANDVCPALRTRP